MQRHQIIRMALIVAASTAVISCASLEKSFQSDAYAKCKQIEDKQDRARCIEQDIALSAQEYQREAEEKAVEQRAWEKCLAESQAVGGTEDEARSACLGE